MVRVLALPSSLMIRVLALPLNLMVRVLALPLNLMVRVLALPLNHGRIKLKTLQLVFAGLLSMYY
jgi:hypothetical protein